MYITAYYAYIVRIYLDVFLTKSLMNMKVNGLREKGRLSEIWMDCIRNDLNEKGINDTVTT